MRRLRAVVAHHLRDVPAVAQARRVVGPSATRRGLKDEDRLDVLLTYVLAHDANCVDIGAHSGAVLDRIVCAAPDGSHIAYEPLPDCAADLRKRFPGVDVREAAAWSAPGTAMFQHVRTRPTYSGLLVRDDAVDEEVEELTVRTEDLDSALPDGYVPTLIKIDAEGAEGRVLAGAVETLRRHQPIVVFEHGKGAAPRYGTHPRDVHGLLTGRAGLRIYDLDGHGPYRLEEFVDVFERGSRWNFFARS